MTQQPSGECCDDQGLKTTQPADGLASAVRATALTVGNQVGACALFNRVKNHKITDRAGSLQRNEICAIGATGRMHDDRRMCCSNHVHVDGRRDAALTVKSINRDLAAD
jgi:hypothetical protein